MTQRVTSALMLLKPQYNNLLADAVPAPALPAAWIAILQWEETLR